MTRSITWFCARCGQKETREWHPSQNEPPKPKDNAWVIMTFCGPSVMICFNCWPSGKDWLNGKAIPALEVKNDA
jgi:hypothetical protein